MGNQTTKMPASITFHAEMQFACHYAMRHPQLAAECAATALAAAQEMHRPDLAYQANELLTLIRK